jgi:hypothetical protein
MKRQLIEDFLNVPGIVGLALMDGQFRSYSYGLSLSGEDQQELLVQGLQQILETTPNELECFTFVFGQCDIFLYKVDRGMCFLVMTQGALSSDYGKSVAQLKRFLKADFDSVAEGLLTAVSPVLAFDENGPIVSAAQPEAAHEPPLPVNSVGLGSFHSNGTSSHSNGYSNSYSNGYSNGHQPSAANGLARDLAIDVPAQPRELTVDTGGSPQHLPAADQNGRARLMSSNEMALLDLNSFKPATVSEVLVAMNQLSQFTTQYLGKFIVANHWRTNCPDVDWLKQFIVTPTGTLSLDVRSHLMAGDLLTAQQQDWVRAWVAGFSQRCAKVIRDYPNLVHQQALDESQWQLLFAAKADSEN